MITLQQLKNSLKAVANSTDHKIKNAKDKIIEHLDERIIKDRTHYDTRYTEEIDNGFNFTFDGNLEGREYVSPSGMIHYVKLSDTPLTKDELLGCVLVTSSHGGTITNEVLDESIVDDTFVDYIYVGVDQILVSVITEMTAGPVTLGPGLWTQYFVPGNLYTLSISKTDIEVIEHGELKQLDAKFIPAYSYNDLTDRTHYYYEERDVILPKIEVSNAQRVETYSFENTEVGDKVLVRYDDVEYECSVIRENSGQYVYTYIGNGSLIKSDLANNGEPFAINLLSDIIECYFTESEVPHTIDVLKYEFTKYYVPLDERYIPDSIARLGDNVPYTEVSELSITKEFVDGWIDGNINDEELEFVRLVIDNHRTTTFEVDGKKYSFDDVIQTNNQKFNWRVVSDDGSLLTIYSYNKRLIKVEYASTASLTVNYIGDVIHKLDRKYIDNMYYDDTSIVNVDISLQLGQHGTRAIEDDEGLFEALMSGQCENILVDGEHIKEYEYDLGYRAFYNSHYHISAECGGTTPYIHIVYTHGGGGAWRTVNITGYYTVGKSKSLDANYLPKHSHSYNDLTDRTHYAEKEEVRITKQIYNNTSTDSDFALLLLENRQNAIYLIEGESYKYDKDTLNDETKTEWYVKKTSGTSYKITVYDKNTDSPYIKTTFGVMIITVSKSIETIHQLDEKYIPDTIARKSDILESSGASSWNDLTDKPFYTEYVTESLTKSVNMSLVDQEFATLYLNNLQTTEVKANGVDCVLESDEMLDTAIRELSYKSSNGDVYLVLICENTPGSGILDTLNCINNPGGTTFDFTVNYQTEIVHKMDEKYLPLDEHTHSYNDLTDKTHSLDYDNGDKLELIPEQVMSVTTMPLGGFLNVHNVSTTDITVKSDDEITLIINGESFTEIVKTIETENGDTVYYIGNPYLMNNMGDYFPSLDSSYNYDQFIYCFAVSSGSMLVRCRVGSSTSTINIKVTAKRPVLHQLDEKYIPDTIARKSDIVTGGSGGELFVVTLTGYDESTWSINKTIEEIIEAYRDGKNVVLIDANNSYYVQKLEQFIYDFQGTPPIIMFSCVIPDLDTGSFNSCKTTIYIDGTITTSMSYVNFGDVSQLKTESWELVGAINELHSKFGDIESICDEVIALQNSYVNGVKVTQEGDTLIIQNGGDADA